MLDELLRDERKPGQVVVRRLIAGVGMVRLGYHSHPKAILHLQLYSQSANSTKGWGNYYSSLKITGTPCLGLGKEKLKLPKRLYLALTPV